MYLKVTYPKFYLFLILFRFQSGVVFFQPETEERACVYKTTSQYFNMPAKSWAIFFQPETEDRQIHACTRQSHNTSSNRGQTNPCRYKTVSQYFIKQRTDKSMQVQDSLTILHQRTDKSMHVQDSLTILHHTGKRYALAANAHPTLRYLTRR